jgi:hypothetical protein
MLEFHEHIFPRKKPFPSGEIKPLFLKEKSNKKPSVVGGTDDK